MGRGEAGHQHRQRRAEGRRNPPTDVIITFSPDHFRHLDCEIDEIVSLSNGSGLSFGSLVTNDALFFVVPGSNPRENSLPAVRWKLIDCGFVDLKKLSRRAKERERERGCECVCVLFSLQTSLALP